MALTPMLTSPQNEGNLRVISLEMLKMIVAEMCLKILWSELNPNLPGPMS